MMRLPSDLRWSGQAPARERPRLTLRWATAIVTIVGFGGALAGLATVIDGSAWWFVVMAVVAVVIAVLTSATVVAVRRWIPVAAAALGSVMTITFIFASDVSIAGIVPTPTTVERLVALATSGAVNIVESSAPASATLGIIFVLAVAVATLAIAAGFVGIVLGHRSLIGIPLLVILAVPGFVSPEFASPVSFAVAAGAWLVLLLMGRPAPEKRRASVLGALAVAVALLVPIAIAPSATGFGPTTSFRLSTGVNPIINLGDDLRRPAPITALSYRTTATTGLYLRLTTLERFTGRAWSPSQIQSRPDNTIDALGPVPGLDSAFAAEQITTSVEVGNILGGWLPTPYPARSVDGVDGQWYWEPDGLTIRAIDSTIRGQKYSVESLSVRPTADQLRTAPPPPMGVLQKYTDVSIEVPQPVFATARSVAGSAATHYDAAMALQNYFRSSEFSYSESAPVQGGYDGSGAAVLGQFLVERRGYCVHFASAMAVMARILDIPSRIAVGFQPGVSSRDVQTGTTSFTVSSNDLHAWPELYFEGFGWIRFEPTPGRGQAPNYETLLVDDPSTPTVDESVPQTARDDVAEVPVDAIPEQGGSVSTAEQSYSVAASVLAGGLPALVLLGFTPALIRRFRRAQRIAAVRRGSALAAWTEVLATATDAGFVIRDADSPRTTAQRFPDSDALREIVRAVEHELFSRQSALPGADADARQSALVGHVVSVARAILATCDRRQRLRAHLLPASLDHRLRRGRRRGAMAVRQAHPG